MKTFIKPIDHFNTFKFSEFYVTSRKNNLNLTFTNYAKALAEYNDRIENTSLIVDDINLDAYSELENTRVSILYTHEGKAKPFSFLIDMDVFNRRMISVFMNAHGGRPITEELALKQYNDYNTVMSVVDKIENMGADFTIRANHVVLVYDEGNIISTIEGNNKLQFIYEACVEFINWYNRQS